jgi:menaquinone-specific isochorismate synthase
MTLRVKTIDIPEPPSILDHAPPFVWMSADQVLVGFGEAMRSAPGIGPGRFAAAQGAFDDWVATLDLEDQVGVPGSGPIAFASFTFDPRSHGSVLAVPEVVIGRHRDRWFMTTIGDVEPSPLFHPAGTAELPLDRPRYAGASIPDVAWLDAVANAIHLIGTSDLEKVVMARDYAVWSKERFDTRRVLARLQERFPDCYVFSVDGLVGASPELLVRVSDLTVESVALAGSARRSGDPTEDEQIAKALIASDKDRREHEMAAASVGDVLADICERILRDPEPELVNLANVRHLATRFRGTLAERRTALEVAGTLHPTAAVGGSPTEAAVEVIRSLEGMDRGRYAGPVGWVDRRGDGEFAIALRCAEISGARARLFAGAGIVEGSLPENELEETRLKLQAMLPALE